MGKDEALRRMILRTARQALRRNIITILATAYGRPDEWVSMASLKPPLPGETDLACEVQYLKDLGYIVEREGETREIAGRMFRLAAQGYALACGDSADETIPE